MGSINKYIPILRTKRGEFTALANLDPELVSNLTPMFEFRPMGISELRAKMTIDAYLARASRNILKGWSNGSLCLIDIYGISHSVKVANATSPLNLILNTLKEGNLNFAPTIGLDREDGYKEELKSFISRNRDTDLCLRLDRRDLELPQKTSQDVNALLDDIDVDKNRIHLLLDFRFLHEETVDALVDSISTLVSGIEIEEWASFTVAGSSIPEDVTGMKTGEPNVVRRKEYELWLALNEAHPLVGRNPTYGDYTIIHPDKPDAFVPPNKISTKIRYTTDDSWLVWRGTRHEKSDTKRIEYQDLAGHIVRHQKYQGKDFSWGDSNIFECSQKTKEYCAAGKWVEIDINHHLAFVSHQIANSPVFS